MPRFSKFIYTFTFIILNNYCFAQIYETNPDYLRTKHWYFGNGVHLVLADSSFTNLADGNTMNWEGSAVSNSRTGISLVYSDGISIWNSDKKLLNSKSLLLGRNSATQAISIINSQTSDSIVHFFTNSDAGGLESKTYYYSITFNRDFDSILMLNKRLVQLNGTEKGNMINHQNNKYTWFISHIYDNDQFYSFLVKDMNLICCPNLFSGNTNYKVGGKASSQGQLKIASNGGLLVDAICNPFVNKVEIFSFSVEKGEIIEFDTSLSVFKPYGVAMSRNSCLLFISNTQGKLFKFNVLTRTLVKLNDSLQADITGLQLTPMGDIIVAEPLKNSLSLIYYLPQLEKYVYAKDSIDI